MFIEETAQPYNLYFKYKVTSLILPSEKTYCKKHYKQIVSVLVCTYKQRIQSSWKEFPTVNTFFPRNH